MKIGYRLFLNKDLFKQINPPVYLKQTNGKAVQLNSMQRLATMCGKRTKNVSDEIYNSLARYILADGTVDGDVILEDYFPTVKTDVFISHSHDDV